jgi:CDP-paratose 2-epimerase
MHLLITGICGFVGSTLAKAIASSGMASQITGIDNFSRAGSELNRRPLQDLGIRIIHGDIRNSSDVDNLPKADWVIDAAANPSVLAGVDGKTSSRQLIEHNLFGTVNLLEYCRRHQAGFVLLSTSRVYSIPGLADLKMDVKDNAFVPSPDQSFPLGITPSGVNESYSTAPPVSLYGSTKVTSEHLALEYGSTFDFPVWINRCGVMAGAGQFGHPAQGIFAYWIHSFREGTPLKYIGFGGSGHQVRDCLHPRDLVPLLQQQLAPSSHSPLATRILNVSGGISSAMSLAQLTRWCTQRYPNSASISTLATRHLHLESRPFDIPWMVLDETLCTQTWNWQPETSIQIVLEEIAQHADQNPNWLATSH